MIGSKTNPAIDSRRLALTEVLQDLCDTIDARAPEIISTILLMDPDGEKLWPAAGRRVPEGWTQTMTPLPIGPQYVASPRGHDATARADLTRLTPVHIYLADAGLLLDAGDTASLIGEVDASKSPVRLNKGRTLAGAVMAETKVELVDMT